MTALFFVIPSHAEHGSLRRVDFAHLARLFAEPDPIPLPPVRERRRTVRLAAAATLFLLGALGDTMLVARPTVAPSGSQQT